MQVALLQPHDEACLLIENEFEMRGKSALAPAEGGPGATFSQAANFMSIGSGLYHFIGSLFDHNLQWRPFQSLPINVNGIDSIIEHKYSSGPPSRLDFTVTISTDPECAAVQEQFGKLERLSPEEAPYAFLLGIAAAVQAGATEEDKSEWRRLMLSVPYRCAPVIGAERTREAINIREDLTTD